VLRKFDYEELIKDFARKKVGENYSTINKMEAYRNILHLDSYTRVKKGAQFYLVLRASKALNPALIICKVM